MKVKVTPSSVEVADGIRKICKTIEVRDALNNGDTVEFTIEDPPEKPKDFWLAKLLEAHDAGDWRNVDRVIQNMRLNYEGPNHTVGHHNSR